MGGRRGNFKLSGQNVKFTHEFTQQKEGEEARAGTPHARVLSVPTFLPHPPLQPEANTGMGSKAWAWWRGSPNSQKVREPSTPEAGGPIAGRRLPSEGSALPGLPSWPIRGLGAGLELGLLDTTQEAAPGQASST